MGGHDQVYVGLITGIGEGEREEVIGGWER